MADNEYNFFSDPDKVSARIREGVGPSTGRRFDYGLASSTWLGGDLFRMGQAYFQEGDYQENITRIEEERQQRLQKRFSDIREQDKTSTAALWGQGAGMLFDPALFGTFYLAAPAKASQLSRLGIRLKSAGVWGTEGAVRQAAYSSSRGHDVDPSHVALGSLLGATLGGALPSFRPRGTLFKKGAARETAEETVEKAPDVAPRISVKPVDEVSPSEALRLYQNETRKRINDPALLPSQEKDIQESLLRALENPEMPESIIKNLIDVPNVAALYTRRDLLKVQVKQEARRRKNKQVGALSDSSFTSLENEFKRIDKALTDLGDNPIGLAIKDIAKGIDTGVNQLNADGLLTAASIRKAIVRPVIGAVAGYGTGAAANLYSEEDDFSPMMFAIMGAVGGAVSGKIVNSTFSPIIKEAGVDAAQSVVKISGAAHANTFFSATSATRLNSFGGLSELFSRTLFNQVGADLRGAAVTSVEARQALIMQEINHMRRIILESQNLGGTKFSMLGFNKNVVRLREASGKYLRGLYGKTDKEATAGLKASGFNAEEVTVILNASAGIRTHLGHLWKSFTDVLPDLKKIENYGLPQYHNYSKIIKNQAEAKKAYGNAFYQQALSKIEQRGGKSILSESRIAGLKRAAQKRADKYVNDIIEKGTPSPSYSRSWKVSSKEDYASSSLKMRSLAKNLEFDRKLTDIKAIKEIEDFMIWDVEEVMAKYVQSSVPTIEFARTYGANGELISALKRSMHKQFQNSKEGATSFQRKALANLEATQMKSIHDSVDMYFGRLHAESRLTGSSLANNIYAVSTTLANLTYLPKVTIASLGDLVQPFQNSGVFKGLSGMARTASKEKGFHRHGFGDVDVLSHELQAYTMKNNPGSNLQAITYGTNQKWFQLIGLAKLTSFARKFAYNTGIEDGFDIAQKLGRGKISKSLQLRANNYGIDDKIVNHLKKFKTVDEAWEDEIGRTYLNRVGKKAADRDALLPQIGNRRGFSQSKNPAIRATGQFLSWAQAKSSQTNALINRMESGDAALAVRMLGSLVIYDGILTFRDFLNDPTGERLKEKGVDTYTENFRKLETVGRSGQFSGNWTPWYIDKVAQLMSTNTAYNPLSNVAPSLGWAWDMITGFSPLPFKGNVGTVWSNLAQSDPEGAMVQVLNRVPLGKEFMDLREGLTGDKLVDKPALRRQQAKGGIVENVPGVPKEPDERIDKMTGLPYNVQAGKAFIDEEDPEKREEFVLGGLASRIASALREGLGKLFPVTASKADYVPSARILSGLKPSSRKTSPPKASEVSPEVPSSAGEDLARLQVAEEATEAATSAADKRVWIEDHVEKLALLYLPGAAYLNSREKEEALDSISEMPLKEKLESISDESIKEDLERLLQATEEIEKPPYPEGEDPTAYRWTGEEWVPKSDTGWLGPRRHITGATMTEFSIGNTDNPLDPDDPLRPSMVPTLTEEEIEFLTTLPVGMSPREWGEHPLGKSVLEKSWDHYKMRREQGLSPFLTPEEEKEREGYQEGSLVEDPSPAGEDLERLQAQNDQTPGFVADLRMSAYEAWKNNVDMEKRLYLQTLFGDRDKPFTRDDFTDEELKQILSLIKADTSSAIDYINNTEARRDSVLKKAEGSRRAAEALPSFMSSMIHIAQNDPEIAEYRGYSEGARKDKLFNRLYSKHDELIGALRDEVADGLPYDMQTLFNSSVEELRSIDVDARVSLLEQRGDDWESVADYATEQLKIWKEELGGERSIQYADYAHLLPDSPFVSGDSEDESKIGTTLGRFLYDIDPDAVYATDKYDFDQGLYKNYEGLDFTDKVVAVANQLFTDFANPEETHMPLSEVSEGEEPILGVGSETDEHEIVSMNPNIHTKGTKGQYPWYQMIAQVVGEAFIGDEGRDVNIQIPTERYRNVVPATADTP